MKKYFLHNGTSQTGPFSVDELITQKITIDTHVWAEGFSAWTRAGDIPELRVLINSTPPPFQNAQPTPPPFTSQSTPPEIRIPLGRRSTLGRTLRWTAVVVLVITATLIGLSVFHPTTLTAGSTLFSDPEKENPSTYLNADGQYHKNLIGQLVINGQVANSATHTNYRDIIIRVSYYDADHSLIEEKDYAVDVNVQYGYTKPFKVKIGDAPSKMKTCGWEVVRASAY
jgi:hypothetical protein